MKNNRFFEEVKERSGQDLNLCYQCLKCAVGCPVSSYLDYKPNSLIRLIQYGQKEKVLSSHTIWLCVSCMTCGSRCPNEVDMSAVMDTLREMALETEYAHKIEKNVVLIHEEFIRSIKWWGRLHEVTFYVAYMLRSFDFIAPLPSGATLISRMKLPFIPHRIKGIKDVQNIFRQTYGKKTTVRGKK